MSVILRISGRRLDPGLVTKKTTLRVVHTFRRGEPRRPHTKPKGPKNLVSGVNIQITPSDQLEGRIRTLVSRAARVVAKHRAELRRMVRVPGVESAVLDIGVARLDVAAQFQRIPAAFLRELGSLGIDLEISIYHAAS